MNPKEASNNPTGGYTNVSVHGINGNGSLSGGTGTYTSGTDSFACGQFSNPLPQIGRLYNITGYHNQKFYEFNAYSCTDSGATSSFRQNS